MRFWPLALGYLLFALARAVFKDNASAESMQGPALAGGDDVAKPQPRVWVSTVTRLLSAFIKQFIWVTGVLALWAILIGVLHQGYTIKPIDVPEELTKAGLDGQAIASLIRDRAATLLSRSSPVTGPRLDLDTGRSTADEVDLKISGTDLSVRALVSEIAKLAGLAPPQFAGTLWRAPAATGSSEAAERGEGADNGAAAYRLAIRDDDGGDEPIVDVEGPLDTVIDQAAVAILGTISPSAAADYLKTTGSNGQVPALALALRAVRQAVEHDESRWFSWWSRIPYAGAHRHLPLALLTEGSVRSAIGQYDLALKAFDDARLEFEKAGDPEGDHYAADGRGYVFIQQAEREASEDKFKRDLDRAEQELTSAAGYDSASYHSAEVGRLRFERAMKDHGCKAQEYFEEAENSFKSFENAQKKFAIAFTMHAMMLEHLASFLHFDAKAKDCVGKGRFGDIAAHEAEADDLFQQAAALDPRNATTWLEWGITTYERQIRIKDVWDPNLSVEQRAALLETAIERMSRAAEFSPKYAFADRRIADTVVARLDITSGRADESFRKEELRRIGINAVCRGLRLPTDDSRAVLWQRLYDLEPAGMACAAQPISFN